ncbi:fructokinase [Pustulibacterium marinum]|uniref:Fructokinase n=1 Tax=Pustulibacterium marinum TaxID=1224947 RepID=A0A1I7GD68_9FLAO|nr:carbohydrate kinase [Pustulibacterium marinum]SFU46404.1 fructokinase [Pustulibacterium marinum]
MHKLNFVSFGEILYDVFDGRKIVGGAPLNVALRMNSFGHQVSMISSIGEDEDGANLIQYLKENHINTEGITTVDYPTGLVQVHLDERNTASYTINYPSAWDKIEVSDAMIQLVKSCDVFLYGSLACRDHVSKRTLFKLLGESSFNVFDVNLRPPHYDDDTVLDLMKSADLIKFNQEEIEEFTAEMHFSSTDLSEEIEFVAEKTGAKTICVTLGKDGAVLWHDNQFFRNNGYAVKVADTVGAGDSFLATLIHNLKTQTPPQDSLDVACAVGSLVTSKRGANPVIHSHEIYEMLQK